MEVPRYLMDYGITLESSRHRRTHHAGQGYGYPASLTRHKDEDNGRGLCD